jgi:hypothetical protein
MGGRPLQTGFGLQSLGEVGPYSPRIKFSSNCFPSRSALTGSGISGFNSNVTPPS